MTTSLLMVLVVAALACPLHMLWATRRGERAACCPPRPEPDADALRTRLRALAEQLASRGGPS